MSPSRLSLLQHKGIILESALILFAGLIAQMLLYGGFGWFRPFWWPFICVGLLLTKTSRILRVLLFVGFMHYYFPLDQQTDSTQFQVFPTDNGCFIVTREFSYRDDPDFYYQTNCYYVDNNGNSTPIFYWRGWAAERPIMIHHSNGDYCLFFNIYNQAILSNKNLFISYDRYSRIINLATSKHRDRNPAYYEPPYRDIARILFQE